MFGSNIPNVNKEMKLFKYGLQIHIISRWLQLSSLLSDFFTIFLQQSFHGQVNEHNTARQQRLVFPYGYVIESKITPYWYHLSMSNSIVPPGRPLSGQREEWQLHSVLEYKGKRMFHPSLQHICREISWKDIASCIYGRNNKKNNKSRYTYVI